MKLDQLIKKLKLPDFYKKKYADEYEISHYYEFSDGSVVMESDQLESYSCHQEQEWFWMDANNEQWEAYILQILDEGSKFDDGESWLEEVLEEYQYVDEAVGEYNSLSNVIDEIVYGGVFIDSKLSGEMKDINIDVTDYFEPYYSKSTGMFCFGNYTDEESVKEALLYTIADVEVSDYDLWIILKEDLQKYLPQYAQKLLTLIRSPNGLMQARDLISAIDPNNFDYLDDMYSEVDYTMLDKVEIALKEIEPSPSDYQEDFFTWAFDAVSYEMDWSKPFTLYHAYSYNPKGYGEGTLYVDERKINYLLCENVEANIDTWDNAYFILNGRYEKTFELGDWYIALKKK